MVLLPRPKVHASTRHVPRQSSSITGIALEWIGSTIAFGTVVRKLNKVRSGVGFDLVPRHPELCPDVGERKQTAGPATLAIDMSFIRTIMTHAAAVYGIEVSAEEARLARVALSHLVATRRHEKRLVVIQDRKDPRNKQGNAQKVPLLNPTGYDAWRSCFSSGLWLEAMEGYSPITTNL